MFKGTYFHTIDDKGRLILPAKFRITDMFVLTCGLDGCVWMYTLDDWNAIDKCLRSQLTIAQREFERKLYAYAADITLDEQGRFTINSSLRAYARLQRQVAIIGVSKRIEIWDKDTWIERDKNISFEKVAEEVLQISGM